MCKPRIQRSRLSGRWHWHCSEHLSRGVGRNWNDVLWEAHLHRWLYKHARVRFQGF